MNLIPITCISITVCSSVIQETLSFTSDLSEHHSIFFCMVVAHACARTNSLVRFGLICMSTFDGQLREYPSIAVDRFTPRANVRYYFLTHVHAGNYANTSERLVPDISKSCCLALQTTPKAWTHLNSFTKSIAQTQLQTYCYVSKTRASLPGTSLSTCAVACRRLRYWNRSSWIPWNMAKSM